MFETRAAGEWLTDKQAPQAPCKLFGDLWLEGELSILFADTGKGKIRLFQAVLAHQLADGDASVNERANHPVCETQPPIL